MPSYRHKYSREEKTPQFADTELRTSLLEAIMQKPK